MPNNGMDKYSDAELVELLQGKKKVAEAAFAELYSRYSNSIYAYCLKIIGNSDDASDIYQDAMVKFYESCKNNYDITNVRGLMVTIARRLCINYLRDNKLKNKNISIEDYLGGVDDVKYEDKELLQIISKCLSDMDFEYREAFVLRNYHGYSYKEMAEITGEQLTTIKTRAWRAKEQLKELIAPYFEDYKK
ncbi:MAG: RNA polymerase sigma factor [Candidatus Kapaibacterium sp.]